MDYIVKIIGETIINPTEWIMCIFLYIKGGANLHDLNYPAAQKHSFHTTQTSNRIKIKHI